MDANLLSSYIQLYNNVLPDNVLTNFEKVCKDHEFLKEGSIVHDSKENEFSNKKIRDTKIWPLVNSEEEKSYTTIHWCNLLLSMFKKYSVEYFRVYEKNNLSQVDIIDIQVLKYNVGGHYQFHVDHSKKIPRTLSFIYLINDDYEGGDLVFATPDFKKDLIIEKKKNTLIIWPSNFMYPHTVQPVTKGTRFSVVGWAL
jgi:Rps23 Pro-64 3,4-dihydroxylase Tpa1-like proline 4-hydroxylase|tara:strand:- start:4936 stop:5529 length:594 start_codon:yes stop_codon:yes gene_type:complete